MGLRPRAAPSLGRPLRRRGAPRLRDPARRTMRLVFAVVLAMQLDRVEASACGLGEYPVGAECCPMCAAGANLVPEVACTYTKNTVCGCLPGYFCSYLGTEDCELCQRYTVCFPGSMVKERGTKTTDNVCEACPPGTSSTANMSYSCTPWPTVKENGRVQGDDRNTSLDPSVTAVVGSVVGIVLVVAAALTYIWQRRKRKNYVPPVQESGTGQQGQALILIMESGNQTTVPVQETTADPEETEPE
ncbi:tumor necrosis factor receptor superfamily member 14 isoform X6 [Buteo buteo]|uniref:tumor necrosis factor receptor superfamily member 14 isoform X6 n=1 Tax=Buteo buteo TaxID=30397 RepID=UPI003EBDD7FE